MKTAEELNAITEEVETLNKKLLELKEDEINQVAGGITKQEVIQEIERLQREAKVETNPDRRLSIARKLVELSNLL